MMYGAIEAGGTKFVCAVANEAMEILDQVTIPTDDPEITMAETVAFFKKHRPKSIGIGTFGPVDINPKSPDYGRILNTPKLKWRQFSLYEALKEAFDIPVIIDTDVNAAALGEYEEGYGKGKRSVLYITVGTGVGAGFVLNGETLSGLTHPEMGHILIRPLEADKYPGGCPSHGNCLEGMVAGPNIEARYGIKGHLLGEDHEVWDFMADYLGQALMAYTLILSPEVILIGGGVSQQAHIFPKIRKAFKKYMNGYLDHPVLNGDLEDFIKYPLNGQKAGLIGSFYLAKEAAKLGL